MAKIDPAFVKTVNWSRKRKRNKKLWKTTRSSRKASAGTMISADELRKRVMK